MFSGCPSILLGGCLSCTPGTLRHIELGDFTQALHLSGLLDVIFLCRYFTSKSKFLLRISGEVWKGVTVIFCSSFCLPVLSPLPGPGALPSHMVAAWQVAVLVRRDGGDVPFEWTGPLPFLLHSESLGAALALCGPCLAPKFIFNSKLGGESDACRLRWSFLAHPVLWKPGLVASVLGAP